MSTSLKPLITAIISFGMLSFSIAQVNVGIEVGAGMGNTRVKNIEEYPDMFKEGASNGGLYSMLNVNFKVAQRLHLKIGAGVKGQPYQFNLNNSYGIEEIEENFSEDQSQLAASYYFPVIFKFKLFDRASTPFIGVGYSYETLFNDLRFDNVDSEADFDYIKNNLHLASTQFGYIIGKEGDPKVELIFTYEMGLNNLATDSYPFSDDFVIRENDFEFGVNWYFL